VGRKHVTQKELKASGAASRARSEARAAALQRHELLLGRASRTVDQLQARFRDCGLYSARKDDVDLLRSLGLRAFERVGHAVQIELGRAKPIPEAPEATIDVAVTCMPSQFWQFTVRRHERGYPAWRITTGSGDFAKFWPIAVGLASGMFSVVPIPHVDRP
jgi:hypothetical protein